MKSDNKYIGIILASGILVVIFYVCFFIYYIYIVRVEKMMLHQSRIRDVEVSRTNLHELENVPISGFWMTDWVTVMRASISPLARLRLNRASGPAELTFLTNKSNKSTRIGITYKQSILITCTCINCRPGTPNINFQRTTYKPHRTFSGHKFVEWNYITEIRYTSVLPTRWSDEVDRKLSRLHRTNLKNINTCPKYKAQILKPVFKNHKIMLQTIDILFLEIRCRIASIRLHRSW